MTKMTAQDVLKLLIKFFKSKDAVDINLSDEEIAALFLPKLPIFQHSMTNDPNLKKEDMFQDMVKALKELFPDPDQPPCTSPNDWTIFNQEITIKDLSENIFDSV